MAITCKYYSSGRFVVVRVFFKLKKNQKPVNKFASSRSLAESEETNIFGFVS